MAHRIRANPTGATTKYHQGGSHARRHPRRSRMQRQAESLTHLFAHVTSLASSDNISYISTLREWLINFARSFCRAFGSLKGTATSHATRSTATNRQSCDNFPEGMACGASADSESADCATWSSRISLKYA